ncbi:hypothetical protein BC936DRAFT_147060 [Jimgerdemannia flammicorona]|uniref:SGNH hydrolase-type esterase domain-containing protein n=1 Tax=Jimgerdemannia flammicorona TaxID=994334 RepID=A0A433D675_9FUNG|nr:hypothetical protein BC936DRAFT_147060 [Jimgerdemannia flammicorona]
MVFLTKSLAIAVTVFTVIASASPFKRQVANGSIRRSLELDDYNWLLVISDDYLFLPLHARTSPFAHPHVARCAPYIRVRFTNTTTLKVNLDGNNNTVVWKIDNGEPTLLTTNGPGTYEIKPAGGFSSSEIYTLMLGPEYCFLLAFKGLVFDEGGHTIKGNFPKKLIEFVGDSVTGGVTDSMLTWSDYSFLTGEALGVEHTQIAKAGMCLTDYGTCQPGSLKDYFTSTYNPGFSPCNCSMEWDFSYQADAVSIMIGQSTIFTNAYIRCIIHLPGVNDHSHGPAPSDVFQSTYTNLLVTVRTKYPKAHIFSLTAFSGFYGSDIVAAIAGRAAAGDHAITFVNTTTWLIRPDDFSNNGSHPNNGGQVKVVKELAPIMKNVLQW